MLDRIDIHIEVPRVDYEKLCGDRLGETSESIRKRVQAALNIQQQRLASSQSDIICNADKRVGEIRRYCRLHGDGMFHFNFNRSILTDWVNISILLSTQKQ